MDQAVRALVEGAGLGRGLSVVAVGGYGRRVLCPGSDVDLMVLHAGRRTGPGEAAERLFYPFWDAGIALGHSVRTVSQCLAAARDRVDTACSLLDARLVAGDRPLFERMSSRLRGALRKDGAGFVERLRDDAARRHREHPSCAHALEPDLKEGAGGLRDIGVVRWASAVVEGDGGGAAGDALLRRREADALDAAEEFLIRLRTALHLEARSRTDRLVLERQPPLARAFGFDATAGLEATDALMRALFEHGRHVEHVRDSVLDRAEHRVSGREPTHVVPARPSSAEDVMRGFAEAAPGGGAVAPEWLDAAEAMAPSIRGAAWTGGTLRAFRRILGAGETGARTLETMDRWGLLAAFLPEWEEVRCRPQRDPYHRFTVDVHLLRTAAETARILDGRTDADPVLAAAAAAIEDRDATLLGALLHDVGKIGRGRHVEHGVRVARGVLDRMGVPGATREGALFLVQEHLLLPDTATRRDLSDENLVLDVAARVRTPERLAMLYVLSVADARATGPHAATAWRLALVRELVGKVERVLESGEMTPDAGAALEERRERVRSLLRDERLDDVEAYLSRLPRPLLLGVEADVAASCFRLVGPPMASTEVRTSVRPGRGPEAYELVVAARDRPGLLAKIAGALALSGFNILSARAFTTEDGVAVDLFEVETAYQGSADEDRWRRFRSTLRKALEGRLSLDHGVRQKRRHYPGPAVAVAPTVRVLNDASDFATVVEVSAPDRIGLLFDLAEAFHGAGLDVHLAKVATYSGRVVDAFYVRELDGRKVEDADRAGEVERAVLARLEEEEG